MFWITVLSLVLFSVVFASVIEGLFHRYILHTPQRRIFKGRLYAAFDKHALQHHPEYREENYHKAPDHYESPISLGPLMWPATMLFTSPVTVGLWLWLGPVALVFPATLSAYYVMYEFLHWHMHFPKPDGTPRWYHKFPPTKNLFEWFDKRHYAHHMIDDTNFNVVLPVYDLVVGHYTTDYNNIPWGIRRRKRRALAKSERLRQQYAGKLGKD